MSGCGRLQTLLIRSSQLLASNNSQHFNWRNKFFYCSPPNFYLPTWTTSAPLHTSPKLAQNLKCLKSLKWSVMGASALGFIKQNVNVRYTMLVWYLVEAHVHDQDHVGNLQGIGISIRTWLNFDQAETNMPWHMSWSEC